MNNITKNLFTTFCNTIEKQFDDNAKNGNHDLNDDLFIQTSILITKMKNKQKEYKKLIKNLKPIPPITCLVCEQERDSKYYYSFGLHGDKICEFCKIKNQEERKQLRSKKKAENKSKTYSYEECIGLNKEFNKLLEYKYIRDNELQDIILDYSNSINFKIMVETVNTQKMTDLHFRFNIDNMWFDRFIGYSKDSFLNHKIENGEIQSKQEVYNHMGNLLNHLNVKLSKCRILSKREKYELEKHWGNIDSEDEEEWN